ncbi:MerR family transcriptional regulator [Furfurilactobacillus sp. WILCCON 0119]|uniref:MerR family transcriptional regulator n=1 Tax=Furfurilactobacillus entadae TaxID=2922307 RepID=UPI0035E5A8B3
MTNAIQNGEQRYRIGDFAEQTGLSSPTLRYYEKEGLIEPHRTDNGLRYYTDADAAWIKFLLHLKDTGMTIEQLKQYVQWRAEGDQTIDQRLQLLKRVQRHFLQQQAELQHSLTILTDKIDWYQNKVDGHIEDNEDFASYLKRLKHKE